MRERPGNVLTRDEVPIHAFDYVEQRMHLIVHICTTQRHRIIEQSHEFDKFRREKPKTPAVVGFPDQFRSHFDIPFGEEGDLKPVPQIAKITSVISDHRTKLCPEPLTHFELSLP